MLFEARWLVLEVFVCQAGGAGAGPILKAVSLSKAGVVVLAHA